MSDNQIRRIFFPFVDMKVDAAIDSSHRFVYYTNAETAFRILQNREIWMRETTTMNDYFEVEHGFNCLDDAYKSEAGKGLQDTLNSCFEGITEEVLPAFNDWLPSIRYDTFIACFSEHPSTEDDHGRLSMWRAYGQRAGVALVFKNDIKALENEAAGLLISPVAYWAKEDVENQLAIIAARINEDIKFVKDLGREQVKHIVFNMFRVAVLCTKHPGFAEEKEWRVILTPKLQPSPLVQQSTEIIKGSPQIIQKLKLKNHEEKGIIDFELPNLLDRIIIGPCEFPVAIHKAFFEQLTELGIPDAGKRVTISQIPLRTPS